MFEFERCDNCDESFDNGESGYVKIETELYIADNWTNWHICKQCFINFSPNRVKRYMVWISNIEH